MADVTVAVGANGSIFQRPDGTFYYLGAFGFPQFECGQLDLATCVRNFLGNDVLPTLDSRASLATIIDREARLDDALSTEAAVALTVGGISPTSYEAQNVAAYLPGGLPQLLEVAPQVSTVIDAETKAFVEASYASGDPYALRSPAEQLTGLSTLRVYEATLGATTNPELQAIVATERQEAMGLLDDLGISFSSDAFATSTFSPTFTPTSPGAFDPFAFGQRLPDGTFGFPTGAASPPIQETGGGILDTIGDIFQSAIPYIPTILTGLSNAGVIRGDVGDAFRTQLPMTNAQAGIGASNLSPYALGAVADPCQNAFDTGGYFAYGLCKAFGTGSTAGLPATQETTSMMPTSPMQLAINSGLCGRKMVARVNMRPETHAALFNQCGGVARRIFVDAPNGQTYILYNAGPATIGANEKSLAKRIARRAGLKLVARGAGGYRRRRRPR